MSSINERVTVKRKYAHSPAVQVNGQARVRNAVIEFVADRSVTDAELNALFSAVDEKSGKQLPYKRWFRRNPKYFESSVSEGVRTTRLSKIGRRVFAHISTALTEGLLPYEEWAEIVEAHLDVDLAEVIAAVAELSGEDDERVVARDMDKKTAGKTDFDSVMAAAKSLVPPSKRSELERRLTSNESSHFSYIRSAGVPMPGSRTKLLGAAADLINRPNIKGSVENFFDAMCAVLGTGWDTDTEAAAYKDAQGRPVFSGGEAQRVDAAMSTVSDVMRRSDEVSAAVQAAFKRHGG